MKKSLKNSFLLATALASAAAPGIATAQNDAHRYEVIDATNMAYSLDLDVPGGVVSLPYHVYSLLARNAAGQTVQCAGIRDSADPQTHRLLESLGYDLKVTDGDLYFMLQKQGMTAPEWPIDRGGCLRIDEGNRDYSFPALGFVQDGQLKGRVQFELYTGRDFETEMKMSDALVNDGPQSLSLRRNAVPCVTNGYREDHATVRPGDRLTIPRICP